MKIINRLKKVFLFALLTFSIFSCEDDAAVALPVNNTIAGIASRNPNLSILVQALGRADLLGTVSGTTQLTVFAPTDDAFRAFLTANSFANLEAVPVPLLKEILLNHCLAGNNLSTSLTTGYVKTLGKGSASTTNTLSMFINTASGVRINGVSSVSIANNIASNGVVHVVDAVIGLPTVVTHALANPNFSTLVSLLNRPGQPNFVTTLNGAGPFTVFAPNNSAFVLLNTELAPGGTASVVAGDITKVLQYHVANGNVLAATLMPGQIVPSLLPGATAGTFQSFTIGLTPARITDIRSRVTNIVATDVQCANGVIHVLERVLLPTF